MRALELPFFVLQCAGVWRPLHWSSTWKIYLYGTYTSIMAFLMITVILSQVIKLFNSLDDPEAFASNSFLLLTLIADCGKALNIWKKRDEIIELRNVLQSDPCLANTEEEMAIQRKFDRLIRSNTLRYGALIGITAMGFIFTSFVEDMPRKSLPYDSWLPFEHYESILGYSIAYGHQIFSLITGGSISAAFDTIVPGLMIQTCAQLNILKQRFQQMPKALNDRAKNSFSREETIFFVAKLESKLLARCVKHHLEIFEFAKKSNDMFGSMIFLQYTVSTIVLCVSVFEVSKMELFSPEFTSVFMYLFCIGIQIFFFCFYGCEVTNESLKLGDAVYEIDWASLSVTAKRSLIMIMARTLRPIKYTSGHVVTLNLDYFNSLLKLSYSAYNVLQQS